MLAGFHQVPTSQTYHHTPGKVKGYAKLDRGESELVDSDARRDRVVLNNQQIVLNNDSSKPYSLMTRLRMADETVIRKEWADNHGNYRELESHETLVGTYAKLSVLENGEYKKFTCDESTAASLLTEMNMEFQAHWNIA